MKSLLSCVSVCDEMDTQGELVMIVEIMKKEAYVGWMVLVVVGVVVARVVAAPRVVATVVVAVMVVAAINVGMIVVAAVAVAGMAVSVTVVAEMGRAGMWVAVVGVALGVVRKYSLKYMASLSAAGMILIHCNVMLAICVGS